VLLIASSVSKERNKLHFTSEYRFNKLVTQ